MYLAKDKIIALFLILSAVSTTVYLLMLGWYNVLTLDDYSCVANVDHAGVFGFVSEMYLFWQGRWSAFTVDALYYKIWGHASNLISFTLVQLFIGYVTVYCLAKKIIPEGTKVILSCSSIIFVNLALMALQEISTFYWLCCPHYILCVWAFMWLCNMLFLTNQYRWWHVLVIVIMSLYLSGLAETISPLVIMVLGIKWLYNIFKYKRYNFVKQPHDRYLTISLIVLCLGFLVMLFAPGNEHRADAMNNQGFMHNFVLSTFCYKWCKATAILFLRFVSKSLYYIAAAVVAAWIGYVYRTNSKLTAYALNVKQMAYLIGGLLLFFAISVAPCVFAMGWYAPPRSFSYMSFVFAFCAVWIGFSLGA